MPTYVLEPNTPAKIDGDKPLRVQVHAGAITEEIVFSAVDLEGQDIVTVFRPGTLVVPKLVGYGMISISLRGGRPFPAGTLLDLTVAYEAAPSADPLHMVAKVNVSGVSRHTLLSLRRDGAAIYARLEVEDDGHDDLTGLAALAQFATREILGASVVDPTSAINVVVAVDGSASMLAPTKDGSVGALVNVLAGISAVVGKNKSVRAALVGTSVEWLEVGSRASLAEDVVRAQRSAALTVGFRSGDRALVGHLPSENTVTWVLTDALPSDIGELQVADEIEGEARHLVVFADAQALRLQGEPGIPSTLVEPVVAEEGIAGRLEFDPGALRRLIKSLLAGCFVPGTDYAKRVAA